MAKYRFYSNIRDESEYIILSDEQEKLLKYLDDCGFIDYDYCEITNLDGEDFRTL